MTTYFLPPEPPLSYSELASLAPSDTAGRIDYETRNWTVRNWPRKVQFLRYLFDCDRDYISDSNSHSKICGDELFEGRRLYGIPQVSITMRRNLICALDTLQAISSIYPCDWRSSTF